MRRPSCTTAMPYFPGEQCIGPSKMSKAYEALWRRLALIAVEEKRFQDFGISAVRAGVGLHISRSSGETISWNRVSDRSPVKRKCIALPMCHKRIVCIQYLGMGQKHGLNRQPIIWVCMIYNHTSCADITLDRVRSTLLNGPEVLT
jgi:hypothetical protein